MPRFRDYEQRQVVFRQFTPEALLEETHPARVVDEVVERLDLGGVYAVYGEEGNAAYHPKMMLKVLFYSYLCGLMSCRKMEDGLQYRADFIYLSGDQVPDFRTLNNFRLRHLEQLPNLFSQIVLLCTTLGMVDFKHLAIDGQKIAACSNFRNNLDRARAKKRLEQVKRGMARLLEQEPDEYVSARTLEAQQTRLARKRERLERAVEALEAMQEEKACVNLTDDESVLMSHKDGRKVPSYNHQSAVDGKYGVSCAVATQHHGDEPGDLFGLVDEACEQTNGRFETVLADSGFCDYGSLKEMEESREETFYVPDRRLHMDLEEEKADSRRYEKSRFVRQEDGTVVCPEGYPMELQETREKRPDGAQETVYRGTMCRQCPVRDACTKGTYRRVCYDEREPYRVIMRERLKTREGRVTYQKRQGIVEPGHGHDQHNLGWRQHRMRGLKKAGAEFLLIRLAGNIAKIARYRAEELLQPAGVCGNELG